MEKMERRKRKQSKKGGNRIRELKMTGWRIEGKNKRRRGEDGQNEEKRGWKQKGWSGKRERCRVG